MIDNYLYVGFWKLLTVSRNGNIHEDLYKVSYSSHACNIVLGEQQILTIEFYNESGFMKSYCFDNKSQKINMIVNSDNNSYMSMISSLAGVTLLFSFFMPGIFFHDWKFLEKRFPGLVVVDTDDKFDTDSLSGQIFVQKSSTGFLKKYYYDNNITKITAELLDEYCGKENFYMQ